MAENIYFETVKGIVAEALSKRGFSPVDAAQNDSEIMTAEFSNSNERVAVSYDEKGHKFTLLRASGDDEYSTAQVYLFDAEAGDGEPQAVSIGNDFAEGLLERSAPTRSVQRQNAAPSTLRNKDKASDETGSVFFVNRIPNILPELRSPLLAHKEHYGQLLPNLFCEDSVGTALRNLLRSGDRAKLDKFFDFLGGMYHSGDTDVKSIITMTILNGISENDIEYAEGMLPEELAKAWTAARKFKGKKVAPEKDTFSQKMFKSMSNGQTTNSLR